MFWFLQQTQRRITAEQNSVALCWSQRIISFIRVHPPGTLNVNNTFHGNLSNKCPDVSVWSSDVSRAVLQLHMWLCAVWCLAVFQCFHASHRLHDRRRILSSHQSLYIYSWFKLIDAVRLLTHQANFKIQTGWLIKHFLSPHITRRLQLRGALERITKTTCDGELTADSLSYSVFVVQRCWEDSVLLKDKLIRRFHTTCFCCAARQLNRTSVLHICGWWLKTVCTCDWYLTPHVTAAAPDLTSSYT